MVQIMDCKLLKQKVFKTKLPPAEQKVADYLIKNFSSIPFCTIEDICTELKVGKATVGRLMTNIGFYGFSHLKREVVKNLEKHTKEKPFHRLNPSFQTSAELINTHFQEAIFNIKRMRADFLQEDFQQIVKYLSTCQGTIYIMGAASSSSISLYFHSLIQYFKPNVILLDADAMSNIKKLINVTKDDLLFSVSYFRYSKTTKKLVDYFHQKEAKVIVLTNNIVNPFATKCDIEVILPDQSSGIFKSRLMSMLYIEMLLKAISAELGCEKRFKEIESLFSTFDVFIDLEVKKGEGDNG